MEGVIENFKNSIKVYIEDLFLGAEERRDMYFLYTRL